MQALQSNAVAEKLQTYFHMLKPARPNEWQPATSVFYVISRAQGAGLARNEDEIQLYTTAAYKTTMPQYVN
jgi:hypothetical protein